VSTGRRQEERRRARAGVDVDEMRAPRRRLKMASRQSVLLKRWVSDAYPTAEMDGSEYQGVWRGERSGAAGVHSVTDGDQGRRRRRRGVWRRKRETENGMMRTYLKLESE
jgi:hypothetical protein